MGVSELDATVLHSETHTSRSGERATVLATADESIPGKDDFLGLPRGLEESERFAPPRGALPPSARWPVHALVRQLEIILLQV